MVNLSVYVVSGGLGTGADRIVRATLAQFPNMDVPVHIIANVRAVEQIDAVLHDALRTNGLIVHTLVDTTLRNYLNNLAQQNNIIALDLQGTLLIHLTRLLQQEPIGEPGLYYRIREPYFKRIEAMEFAVDHDDGKRIDELHLAEIVLTGVSRVGKTPLSMYLSTLGWRIANVPLMREVTPPAQLFEIDPRRVVGLAIDPGQLVSFRQFRQQRLGLSSQSTYAAAESLFEEVEFAKKLFRRGHFSILDITDRPIEESAEEVINRVTRRLRDEPPPED
jgi:hypothetical protein